MFRTHFEAVVHRKGGSFSLISSALTGSVWDGNIWVFNSKQDFKKCPNIYMVNTRTPEGLSDTLWLSDGQSLLLASDSGKLEIWSCNSLGNTLESKGELESHDNMVLCMCRLGGVTTSGDKVVSGGADGRVIVWDVTRRKKLQAYRGHTDMVLSVASNDESSDCFVSSSQDGYVRLWDLRLPKPARNITTCKDGIHCSMAWGKESLALGNERGEVEVLDMRENSGFLFSNYHPHSKSIRRLAFAPWDSDVVASTSDDMNVRVYSIRANNSIYQSTDHSDFVRGLSWDTEGRGFLTCAWDGQVLHHDVPQEGKSPSPLTMDALIDNQYSAITGKVI